MILDSLRVRVCTVFLLTLISKYSNILPTNASWEHIHKIMSLLVVTADWRWDANWRNMIHIDRALLKHQKLNSAYICLLNVATNQHAFKSWLDLMTSWPWEPWSMWPCCDLETHPGRSGLRIWPPTVTETLTNHLISLRAINDLQKGSKVTSNSFLRSWVMWMKIFDRIRNLLLLTLHFSSMVIPKTHILPYVFCMYTFIKTIIMYFIVNEPFVSIGYMYVCKRLGYASSAITAITKHSLKNSS